jgi:SAM-dependent methyltransferase
MPALTTKELYERQYQLHRDGQAVCQQSVCDLAKSRRRVTNVLSAFDISDCCKGGEVLDVGCGLGYYSKALSSAGANVTGVDLSQVGVEIARTAFPDCKFICAEWPNGISRSPKYDMIWAVDLSLINTFDTQFINRHFIQEALARLKPNGCIVVGWSTDFSGRTIGNWSHWSMAVLDELNRTCGLSSPFVGEARNWWMSRAMMQAGRLLRRSVPTFLFRRMQAGKGIGAKP